MAEFRRNFLRFYPEATEIAIIQSEKDPASTGNENLLPGLILDQSHKGCSLILINRDESESFLPVGYQCMLQVGNLAPMEAELKWRERLPSNVLKVGFEFLQ